MYRHFALIIAVFIAGAQVRCSEYDVEQCMIPITDFRHKLGISNGSASLDKQDKIIHDLQSIPLYSLNDQQLNDFCKYGRQTAVCLNGLNIINSLQPLFEGFLDSADFLCKETMEEYKSYQQCYAKTIVQNGLEGCNNESIAISKYMLSDPFMSHDQFCGYMKEDFRCVRDAVESDCGKEAADWLISYGKAYIKPMMRIIDCADELFPQTGNGKEDPLEKINIDLDDNTYKDYSMVMESIKAFPQWTIWTIITISVIILAVIIYVIVALACAKRRKNTASKVPYKNVLFSPVATEAPSQYSDIVKEP